MKKHIIKIPTNEDKIYRQILLFMNFLLELTEQERQVLAELIVLNNDYEVLPVDKRAKFILSTDMRKEMRTKLEIEEKQFNGLLTRLKKKSYLGQPILSKEGIIHEGLLFKPDEEGMQIEVILNKAKKVVESPKVVEEPPAKEVKEKIEPKESNGTIITDEYDTDDIVIT